VSSEVLAAALEAMAAKGSQGVRFGDVARRSGVPAAELKVDHETVPRLLAAAMVAADPEPFREAAARLGRGDVAGPTPAQVEAAGSTRDRLLVAALAVLDDDGYRGATIGEISRRAGLTTGAIYANFGSKQELLHAAMASRYEALFRAVLDDTVDGPGDVGSALAGFLTRAPSSEHTALVELIAAAARDAEVRRSLRKELLRRRGLLSEAIDERLTEQGSAAADLPTLAFVVQTLALGSVVAQSVGLPTPSQDDLATLLARFADRLPA